MKGAKGRFQHGLLHQDVQAGAIGPDTQRLNPYLLQGVLRLGLSVLSGQLHAYQPDVSLFRGNANPAGRVFLRSDYGKLPFRSKSVADFDVDAGVHGGRHGGGIQHFGTVGCHIQRTLVRHPRDGARRTHLFGVGGHNAGNVGPDLEAVGLQRGGKERGAVV